MSGSDDPDDQDTEADDPRKEEDWKIQKRRGFIKDREDKMKNGKQSKTSKRNSKEPLVRSGHGEEEERFDFLDKCNIMILLLIMNMSCVR